MAADPMVRRAQPGYVAIPASLLALANCRQPQVTVRHATLCPSIEAALNTESRSQATRGPVSGEPGLTGVWQGLGLAGMPGRKSSLAG
jgi:hypothetical protein